MTLEEKRQIRVGVLATLAILISILCYQFLSKNDLFDRSMKLYVFTEDTSGISTETPILIQGHQIGRVSDLELMNGKVLLEFSIDREHKLGKQAQFFFVSSGFLGSKQIKVDNAKLGEEIYAHGDTITSPFHTKPISGIVDSTLIKEIEPALKELSKTIGKALLEYSESGKETVNDQGENN